MDTAEMLIYLDCLGNSIRLTDERIAHIQQHPEMRGLESLIGETLLKPDRVIRSTSDSSATMYYSQVATMTLGLLWLCVVVKMSDDPFIITAYLTDHPKKGESIWITKK